MLPRPVPMSTGKSELARTVSRRQMYVLAAVCLAAGAPLGMLALRAMVARQAPTIEWLEHELVGDRVLYLYLGFASALVFGVVGFVLGGFEDRLERLSAIDPLTELMNRRRFTELVDTEIARAIRYGKPLSFLLIDVDDFKHINDAYGHVAGDTALRAIADCLRSNCRVSDTPSRYGGDEFAVLLTETGQQDAERFAERLTSQLRESTPYVQGAKPPTLSIGIAELHIGDAAEIRQLVRRADTALYEAKHLGRNRTSIAPPPGSTPSPPSPRASSAESVAFVGADADPIQSKK